MTGAGVSTAVMAPSVLAATGGESSSDPRPSVPGTVVAFVRDAAAGEVVVMLGERQVVVHDKDLARRIASHAV
jgi:hypothetical protein